MERRLTGRTVVDLERAWRAVAAATPRTGLVRLITLRLGDGEHGCPERAALSPERGVEGDRWAQGRRRHLDAQVTLMDVRVAEVLAAEGAALDAAGDNFLVDLDLGEDALPAGTRLRIGGAMVEVSALPHTGCKKFRQRFGSAALDWVNEGPNRARRLRGVNCRVIEAGEVTLGDRVAPA